MKEKKYLKEYIEEKVNQIQEKEIAHIDGGNSVGGVIREKRYIKDREIGDAINNYFEERRQKERRTNKLNRALYFLLPTALILIMASISILDLDNLQKRTAVIQEVNKTQCYKTSIKLKNKELGPESIIRKDITDKSSLEFKITSHFDYSPDFFLPATVISIDYLENKDKSYIGLHVPSDGIKKGSLGGFIGKNLSCSELCNHSIKTPSKEGVYRLIFQTYKIDPNYSLVKGLKKKDILLEEKIFPLIIGNPEHKIFIKHLYTGKDTLESKAAIEIINLGDKPENFELAPIEKAFYGENIFQRTISILQGKREKIEVKAVNYESKILNLEPHEKKTIVFNRGVYGSPNNYYDFMDCTYVGIKRKTEERKIIASNEDISSLIFNLHGKENISILKAMKLIAVGPADDFFIDSATNELLYYFKEKGLFKHKINDPSEVPYIFREYGWLPLLKKQKEQQK